ncbi:histidine--tRNA ligase [Candidatus Woesearchaeota archaeon]|nr:histidine--tRNA ligase [Candidatus Woesearchaeota archaeon]
MKLQLPKGMRDINPEDKILRDSITNELKKTFEVYGFNSLETPIVERFDILANKFGAGESSDAMKETFKLKDQGSRDLGLRFDLTVPLARYIAMNPNIKLPFKRYQIGEVFRDGPIKLGRYREFWQCDVDVVGTRNMLADAELIKLSLEVFQKLKLNASMEINNRKLLESLMKNAGVKKEKLQDTIIIIDKLQKLGLKGVKEELSKILDEKTLEEITKILKIEGTAQQIFDQLEPLIKGADGREGIEELKKLFSYFNKKQKENIKLNLSLARGFGYYTGTIFEGFLNDSQVTSSICGGGRYDRMIGNYAGSGEYPAVGISFGLDVISEAIKIENPDQIKTKVKIYVIPIKTTKEVIQKSTSEAIKVIDKLRKEGIPVDMDITSRAISKNLDYVDKMDIPYALIIGKKEINQHKFTLRNMKSGKEKLISYEDLLRKLK